MDDVCQYGWETRGGKAKNEGMNSIFCSFKSLVLLVTTYISLKVSTWRAFHFPNNIVKREFLSDFGAIKTLGKTLLGKSATFGTHHKKTETAQ